MNNVSIFDIDDAAKEICAWFNEASGDKEYDQSFAEVRSIIMPLLTRRTASAQSAEKLVEALEEAREQLAYMEGEPGAKDRGIMGNKRALDKVTEALAAYRGEGR